jgi:threonyl-tRNA synthetase
MNLKIRSAELQQVPYMLVVGDKEAASGQVAVRTRDSGDLGPKPLAEFMALAREAVGKRK